MEEALELLRKLEPTKKARTETVTKQGYPAYTTSVGCKQSVGYSLTVTDE